MSELPRPAGADAPSGKVLALGELEEELANTRRILERIPEEHLGWRPHARSWTLGELALHIARLPTWGVSMLSADEFDLATLPPRQHIEPTRAMIVEENMRHAAELRAAVEQVPDAALADEWVLRSGETVVWRGARASALRRFTLNHLVHHRGQLSVYMRLLDLPVPGLYGPSADEMASSGPRSSSGTNSARS